ncbi:eukaryotic translation initiation factor 3, subunit 6 [Plasmodium vivax India VII]|uniref:Eukaryotic translation initiation factor 3 subunit E n=1 Tax=Plasmodium vivax India VII TaxID=1077284 RepID=A0A0J9SDR9_PLAVI|nr:eukaryotic translation initiation factor 3, subunit 6 [Plasmodium vivax India VII]CAI7720852.1 eukaryotic translation initiation factor 3 subunit E, putative [Plasmodium vivax]
MEINKSSNNDQTNLISKICAYLDPHMTQIILSWMKENKVLNEAEIEQSLGLLKEGCEKEIVNIENEFTNGNRGVIVNCLDSLEVEIEEFQDAMNMYKNDQVNKIGGTVEKKSIMSLREWCGVNVLEKTKTYNFTDSIDDKILKLSRYYYQKKDYQKSKQHLLLYILNISEIIINISDSPKMRLCYWGIISNIINSFFANLNNDEYMLVKTEEGKLIVREEIINEINVCIETIVKLSQVLNKDKVGRSEIILQRSWLIHWSLILIFHFFMYLIYVKSIYPKNNSFSMLQDWFIDEKNLSIINLICPHIIRYYCVYAIFYRNRKDHFELILNTLNLLKPKYTDPFTSLLISIFTEYDFNMAQTCIAQLGSICEKDIFLFKLKPFIEEQSRYIIFETYCRIHKSINIDMIANKVNLPRDDAEKWVVNLIRNAKLDAKIDSEKNCIEISTTLPNLYQQVIDKTQNLTMRSNFLVQVLNRSSTDEHFQKNIRFKNKNEKGKNPKRGGGKQYNSLYSPNKGGIKLVSANM